MATLCPVKSKVLWVLQFRYMPYYMGFGVLGVFMSQYWHFAHISYFSCASRAEVSKMLFLCFRPEPMLIKGLKALNGFNAKA